MDMDKCGITRCHLTCSCIFSASEGICLLITILPSSEGVTDSSELFCLQLYDVLILTFIDFNVSGLCWSPLGFTTWSYKQQQLTPGKLNWISAGLPSEEPLVHTPAGQTLRVLKTKLRRTCCLCKDFCKRLDFLVFSDKDDKLYWLCLKTLAHISGTLKGQVHGSAHAHLSKCYFVAGTRCMVYASNMIMS